MAVYCEREVRKNLNKPQLCPVAAFTYAWKCNFNAKATV